MAKVQSKYVCQNCAYESPRWIGRCPNCGEWNTFVEEITERSTAKARRPAGAKAGAAIVRLTEVDVAEDERLQTNIAEFDRVLGGGIVPGSVILLGGDPGVGKSTLMLQLAAQLQGRVVLYISGEESARQIKLRAERLNFTSSESLLVLSETNVEVIAGVIERAPPDVIIVDSIQTMYRPQFESSPGSVAQVRESTALFTRIAKSRAIPTFLIGHVTKEGVIAGPKVIEHMVDTVLQFEGERHYAYRILRAIKNRFGSTNEIGVFEMRDVGLMEVKNPSEVFLSERSYGASGSTVVASLEGTRPILIEVQALVTPTSYNVPQRNTTGFDYRRLSLLIAVLEKRLGMALGQYDVFVNIAGGVRVDEPAVDLGIAASIISSMRDVPIDSQSVAVGEIGLAGEVRTVSQIEKRVQEAAKLGFDQIIVPKGNLKGMMRTDGIKVVGVDRIEEAIKAVLH
ncbi:MAG: DNA repair protein RadA [Ignavibacteriae bacterium]|nr:DNA repair protein RadA [Ignavibacteria bacterium]MBI3364068.1 DNA repair protein RadA [Ignavibacteriota bacterium]